MSGYYFHCEYHRCTCPEVTCIRRQENLGVTPWANPGRVYDEYCQSGKCVQGQEILARHREYDRRVPPRPIHPKSTTEKEATQPFEDYRKCRICGMLRHYTQMEKHREYKDNIGTRCKPCMNEKQREYARLRKARAKMNEKRKAQERRETA